jgi:hypothetical protein
MDWMKGKPWEIYKKPLLSIASSIKCSSSSSGCPSSDPRMVFVGKLSATRWSSKMIGKLQSHETITCLFWPICSPNVCIFTPSTWGLSKKVGTQNCGHVRFRTRLATVGCWSRPTIFRQTILDRMIYIKPSFPYITSYHTTKNEQIPINICSPLTGGVLLSKRARVDAYAYASHNIPIPICGTTAPFDIRLIVKGLQLRHECSM